MDNLIEVIATIFDFTHIKADAVMSSLALAPLICLQTFGRGWGTPLVMASHNDFKAKVHHLSLAVVVSSVLLTLACTFVTVIFYGVLSRTTFGFFFSMMHPQTSLYVAFPSVFGTQPAANVCLILFFLMITLSEISSIVIQLSGLLTSFFDEFDQYRDFKTRITGAAVGLLAFITILFCSNVRFGKHFF